MGVPHMSLARQLADLGWEGIPLPTAAANVLWLFVSGGMDASAVVGRLEADGRVQPGLAGCRQLLSHLLHEAALTDRLELLRRPLVREPEQLLAMLERMTLGTRVAGPKSRIEEE